MGHGRPSSRDGPSAASKDKIHDAIHDYFEYLHELGVVQVNLIHLSDNAFGGMALYDVMFMVNSWQRTGVFPTPQDGFTRHGRPGRGDLPAGHAGVGPVGEAGSRGAGARDHVAAVPGVGACTATATATPTA